MQYLYNQFMTAEQLNGYFRKVQFDAAGFSERAFTEQEIEDEMQSYAQEFGMTEAEVRDMFSAFVVTAEQRDYLWERWQERGV